MSTKPQLSTTLRPSADRTTIAPSRTVVLDSNDQPLGPAAIEMLLESMLPSLPGATRRALLQTLTSDPAMRWTSETLAVGLRQSYAQRAESGGGDREEILSALADLSRHEDQTWRNGISYTPQEKFHRSAFQYPNPTSQAHHYRGTHQVLPYARLDSVIDRATPVITAGSCFASEVARYMQQNGFNYVVTQHSDPNKQGYATAPAAWGVIFNVAAFRQLAQRAFREVETPRILWRIARGERVVYRDPFRDEVEFGSVEEYDHEYEIHREACRSAFLQAETFVLTLGLTEIWRMKADGAVLSRVPWRLSPALVEHHVMSTSECLAELELMRETLQRHNPRMRFIVTVSPVPLQATFRGDRMDCITASTHSKATLRVVAQEWSERHEDVTYFPSFETVMTCSPDPWQYDQRHVRRETVDKVMHLFERTLVRHSGVQIPGAVERARVRGSDLTLLAAGAEFDALAAGRAAAILGRLRAEGVPFRLLLVGHQAQLASLAERVYAPTDALKALGETDVCIWGGGAGDRALLAKAREEGMAILSCETRDLELGLRTAHELQNLHAVIAELAAEAGAGGDQRAIAQLQTLQAGYARFLADRETPHEAYVAMRELQLEARPTRASRLSDAVARAWPPRPVVEVEGALFPELDDRGVTGVVEQLDRVGFVQLGRPLPTDLVEELVEAGRRLDVVANTGGNRTAEPAPVAQQRDREPASTYAVSREQLVQEGSVQRLMAEPGFLRLAQRWLGCEPTLDLVTMWWSFPHGDRAWSEAAQLYHHDMDRLRWLKLFVYLTDVDETNGPHHFVKNTHRDCHPVLARDGRIPDEEVHAHHGGQVHRVTAPRGTVFLADTSGLHKGGQVLEGERLMLQLEWTSSLFGAPLQEHSWKAIQPSGPLADLQAGHPRVFDAFYGAPRTELSD